MVSQHWSQKSKLQQIYRRRGFSSAAAQLTSLAASLYKPCVWARAERNTHKQTHLWVKAGKWRTHFHLCISRRDLLWPSPRTSRARFNFKEGKKGKAHPTKVRAQRAHSRFSAFEPEVKLGTPWTHHDVVASPQLTHVGVSFTRLRRIDGAEIRRRLFLEKTLLARPLSLSLCKVFLLEKYMTGGGLEMWRSCIVNEAP